MLDLRNLIQIIQNSKGTLFIMCGFPYAGKSYVVNKLQSKVDIKVISIDDILKSKKFDWNTSVLPNKDEWQQIFNESYEKTKAALEKGKNVLYDSTNQTVASRDMLRKVAHSIDRETRVLYIKTPIQIVWQRWEKNQKELSRSVIAKELVQLTISSFEEPTENEHLITINNF